MNLEQCKAVLTKIAGLELSAAEINQHWKDFLESKPSIKDEISKFTKAQLLSEFRISRMYESRKKDEIVGIAIKRLTDAFTPPGDSIVYSPSEETYEQCVSRYVATWTDELIERLKNPPLVEPEPVAIAPAPKEPSDWEIAQKLGEQWLKDNKPAWAEEVIVAEFYVSDCDIGTDYFNGHSTKIVPLAWSRHRRRLFPEMRKAADLYPPVHHLGTDRALFTIKINPNPENESMYNTWFADENGTRWWSTRPDAEAAAQRRIAADNEKWEKRMTGDPEHRFFTKTFPFGYTIREESIEHREDYSMGHGLYLGHDRYAGWQVRKTYPGAIAQAMGSGGEHTLDKGKSTPVNSKSGGGKRERAVTPVGDVEPLDLPDGVTLEVIKSFHAKKEKDIWVVQVKPRVERTTFDSLCSRAKSLGGYYSRFQGNGAIPGFVFFDQSQAGAFAEVKC